MPARSVVVVGRVQGVGFRAFVVRQAGAMGVVGEVWNRWDGCVELVAEHESEPTLQAFVRSLESGPGRVDRVLTSPATPGSYSDFSIAPTR